MSIVAYAANTATGEYKITHLNAGGDDISHKIKGVTFSALEGGSAGQVDAGLFGSFGTSAQIEIDFAKANFDWNRLAFPSAKEAHMFVVFTFPANPTV